MSIVIPNGNKAVVLFSSPNHNGHTAKLYNNFINNFDFDIEYINIYNCFVKPCIDCKACIKNACPYNKSDDMDKILNAIYNAKIVICATPIYFNGIPAPFKAVMDRCQQLFLKIKNPSEIVLSKKRAGILLTTAGSDDDDVTKAIYNIFNMFFNCFKIQFLEHIAQTNTDVNEIYQINQSQINNIKKYLKEVLV